jgi:hypothetical protein
MEYYGDYLYNYAIGEKWFYEEWYYNLVVLFF